MLRDFVLGFVKIHVLHHAAQAPIYGLAMMEELRRHGYEVSPGTIYPVLHGLETDGYLAREERVVGGKVRKYYDHRRRAGRAGGAQAKIVELTHEVVEELLVSRLPEPSADDEEEGIDDDRPLPQPGGPPCAVDSRGADRGRRSLSA